MADEGILRDDFMWYGTCENCFVCGNLTSAHSMILWQGKKLLLNYPIFSIVYEQWSNQNLNDTGKCEEWGVNFSTYLSLVEV